MWDGALSKVVSTLGEASTSPFWEGPGQGRSICQFLSASHRSPLLRGTCWPLPAPPLGPPLRGQAATRDPCLPAPLVKQPCVTPAFQRYWPHPVGSKAQGAVVGDSPPQTVVWRYGLYPSWNLNNLHGKTRTFSTSSSGCSFSFVLSMTAWQSKRVG